MNYLLNFIMDHPGKMNFGLLIIRIIVGFSMAAFHGWGKITAPDKWVAIGAVSYTHLTLPTILRV